MESLDTDPPLHRNFHPNQDIADGCFDKSAVAGVGDTDNHGQVNETDGTSVCTIDGADVSGIVGKEFSSGLISIGLDLYDKHEEDATVSNVSENVNDPLANHPGGLCNGFDRSKTNTVLSTTNNTMSYCINEAQNENTSNVYGISFNSLICKKLYKPVQTFMNSYLLVHLQLSCTQHLIRLYGLPCYTLHSKH